VHIVCEVLRDGSSDDSQNDQWHFAERLDVDRLFFRILKLFDRCEVAHRILQYDKDLFHSLLLSKKGYGQQTRYDDPPDFLE
jgi:hypothetical protein